MIIIYPPYIAETIPAFTVEQGLIIPFQNNPAVNWDDVGAIEIRIKDLNSNLINYFHVYTTEGEVFFDRQTQSGEIRCSLRGTQLNELQYYKFQIGYRGKITDKLLEDAYTHSAVSIGRYIGSSGEISINNFNDNNTEKYDTGIYFGNFSKLKEPLYSYRFEFFEDSQTKIIQDTGEVLYSQETPFFRLGYELKKDMTYRIRFSITTINGFKNSKEYRIIKSVDDTDGHSYSIKAGQRDEKSKENGYAQFWLEKNGQDSRGTYLIERSTDCYKWDLLFELVIENNNIEKYNWRDLCVEQGVTYYYSIRKTTPTLYYARKISNPVSVDYEDIFIGDGEKQLRVQFNPKVSSFKNTILEQKIDTIGSKYPFIFRNGDVNYKEFSVSGLISYLMDNEDLFIAKEELGLDAKASTINLADYNFYAERKFKLEVLNWLTNGKSKIFRSPAEGVYVVRLMNVSLSPEETLGRLLHNFNATAYEVDGVEIEKLIQEKMIRFPTGKPLSILGYFILGFSTLGE